MIYIFEFIKFLFEQFEYIFGFMRSFFDIVEYFFSSGWFFTGIPGWFLGGLCIPLILGVIFRITQLIPAIGGFDS